LAKIIEIVKKRPKPGGIFKYKSADKAWQEKGAVIPGRSAERPDADFTF